MLKTAGIVGSETEDCVSVSDTDTVFYRGKIKKTKEWPTQIMCFVGEKENMPNAGNTISLVHPK